MWEYYSIPAIDESHCPVMELADCIKSNESIVDRNCILIFKLNSSIKRLWLPTCWAERSVCPTEFSSTSR